MTCQAFAARHRPGQGQNEKARAGGSSRSPDQNKEARAGVLVVLWFLKLMYFASTAPLTPAPAPCVGLLFPNRVE